MGPDIGKQQFGTKSTPDTPQWVQDIVPHFDGYLRLRIQIEKSLSRSNDLLSLRLDCDSAMNECFGKFMESIAGMLPKSIWLNNTKGSDKNLGAGQDRIYLPQTHELLTVDRPEYFEFMARHDSIGPPGDAPLESEANSRARFKINFHRYHPAGKEFIGIDEIREIAASVEPLEQPLPINFSRVYGVESFVADVGSNLSIQEAAKILRISRMEIDDESQVRLDATAAQMSRVRDMFNEHRVPALDEFGLRMKESLGQIIGALSKEMKELIPKSICYGAPPNAIAFLVDSMELVRINSSPQHSGLRGLINKLKGSTSEHSSPEKDIPPDEWILASDHIMTQIAFTLGPSNFRSISDLVRTPKWAR